MRAVRFVYTRHYKNGLLISTRWFELRVYPPVLPTWQLWRRR